MRKVEPVSLAHHSLAGNYLWPLRQPHEKTRHSETLVHNHIEYNPVHLYQATQFSHRLKPSGLDEVLRP
jgi:hypothetical protein